MNAMLAQMPVLNFTQIGMACVAVAALTVLVNQLFKFKRNFGGTPPVGELQGQVTALHQRVQKLEEFEKAAPTQRKFFYDKVEDLAKDSATAMDVMRREIKADIGELRKENKSDANDLNKRIDDVLKAVSRLEGRTTPHD